MEHCWDLKKTNAQHIALQSIVLVSDKPIHLHGQKVVHCAKLALAIAHGTHMRQ
jgi:hypothetical protein